MNGTRLFGIENRKMAANDFIGAVAIEPLGAGVPGSHVPGAVKHENSVINDRLHHETQTLSGKGR